LLDGARLLAGPLRHHPAGRHGDTRALLQVRGLASAPVRPLSRAHPVLWEPLLSTAAVGSLSVSARRTDRLRRRLSLAAQPIPSPALYAPTFRNSGGRSALTYGSNLSAHRSGASGLIAARRPRASLSADNGVELSPLPSINSSTDTFGCFPWAAI